MSNATEYKKFRTLPGRGPVRIALTSGHETWVTEEWEPLAPIFHREALADGCISEDMAKVLNGLDAEPVAATKPRADQIAEVIAEMLDANEPAYIDDHGKPVLSMLSDKLGFKVTAKERDTIFDRLAAGH
jgi:hypothetical protein